MNAVRGSAWLMAGGIGIPWAGVQPVQEVRVVAGGCSLVTAGIIVGAAMQGRHGWGGTPCRPTGIEGLKG